MSYTFDPLKSSETDWVNHQLELANQFAIRYGVGIAPGLRATLEQLDEAFRQFVESNPNANEEANSVVLLLGAALGAHLVRTLDLEWVIATDDYGTDLAVVGRRGCGDITLFPNDFVAKRWERRETGFLADVPDWMRGVLAKSAREWAGDA